MMYRNIECPNCGNEVLAKNIKEAQKCKFCKRLFAIKTKQRGRKFIWDAVPVEFETVTLIKK